MAKEVLKKIEEQLDCSICLDTYTDPKLLQCFHVYCQQCLVSLIQDHQGQPGLACPNCRQVTPVPEGGVAGLQSAFHINRILELLENAATTQEGGATDADVVKLCFEHPEEESKLHCETCGELVCIQCILKDGKHHNHDCAVLSKAFSKYKGEITSLLESVEKQEMHMWKAIAHQDMRSEDISDQQEATKESIHVTFRQLRETLNVRENELISQLDQITRDKLKRLAIQKDQIETTLAQLSSCLHFMRESLRTACKGNVLIMKANTIKRVKQLTTPFQPEILEPNTEADIVFLASADAFQDFGQICILTCDVSVPSRCHATGKGVVEVAAVGEKSTAILQAINFKGKPCEELKSLECQLSSEITSTRVICSVERKGLSQYEICYQPNIKGGHQLHVKVEGQHIRGSPFSVAVKSPVEKLGTPILTLGEMGRPWGIAVNESGEVVVTKWDEPCVSVFSPGGEKLQYFGTRGSGEGQFINPCGVAVDVEGNILVADLGNSRVQKFTAEGQFLTAVGANSSRPLEISSPTDIATKEDRVYVLDDRDRVLVLNSDLTFSSTFGGAGSGEGQFSSPRGIACDSSGKVYVADSGNSRMQVFTAEGKFLRLFGGRGQGRGELDWPTGVAVDKGGMVYVSEGGNCRVSVFTSEGQFVTSFGRKGEGSGEFRCPCGLAVDNSGVVYVCDRYLKCVIAF